MYVVLEWTDLKQAVTLTYDTSLVLVLSWCNVGRVRNREKRYSNSKNDDCNNSYADKWSLGFKDRWLAMRTAQKFFIAEQLMHLSSRATIHFRFEKGRKQGCSAWNWRSHGLQCSISGTSEYSWNIVHCGSEALWLIERNRCFFPVWGRELWRKKNV